MKKFLFLIGIFLLILPYTNSKAAEQYSYGIKVNMPSQLEIKNRINAISDINTKYSVDPNFDIPYSDGKLSSDTTQNALAWINVIRYIVGIPEVSLNSEYCEYAQAASMVNYVNDLPSHYPDQPSGMNTDLYKKGYDGSSKCDISYGYGLNYMNGVSFKDIIINNWMFDSDENNISNLGHRRWILNPSMSATGFGCVWNNKVSTLKYIAALYAIDSKGSSDYYGIAWPANNTPTTFFNTSYAWSISIGKTVSDDAKVEIVRLSDNKSWTMSKGSSNFYINNEKYGKPGCIIFKPNGITTNHGDSYKINITGTNLDIQYYVNFFDPALINESSPTSVVETSNTDETKLILGPIDKPDNKKDDKTDTSGDITDKIVINGTTYENSTVKNSDGSKTTIEYSQNSINGVELTIKNTKKNKVISEVTYKILDNDELMVVYVNTKKSSYTFENSIKINKSTYYITKIGSNVLKNNKTVKKIIIKDQIESIESNAFNGNSKIKTVYIYLNNYLTIGKNAFYKTNNKVKFQLKGTTDQFNRITDYLIASNLPNKADFKKVK